MVPVSTAARTTIGAAAAALLLALAGCGGEEQKPSVASAGGTPSAAAATGDAVSTYVEGVRKYVTCVRGEGVEITDPDAKGKFEYQGDTRLLKKDPKFLAAQTKCTSLLPPVPEGMEEKPVMTAAEIETKRSYAKCMREKGAADFPDPGPDGYWPESADGKPTWKQGAPAVKGAEAACGPIIGAPASPDPGQG